LCRNIFKEFWHEKNSEFSELVSQCYDVNPFAGVLHNKDLFGLLKFLFTPKLRKDSKLSTHTMLLSNFLGGIYVHSDQTSPELVSGTKSYSFDTFYNNYRFWLLSNYSSGSLGLIKNMQTQNLFYHVEPLVSKFCHSRELTPLIRKSSRRNTISTKILNALMFSLSYILDIPFSNLSSHSASTHYDDILKLNGSASAFDQICRFFKSMGFISPVLVYRRAELDSVFFFFENVLNIMSATFCYLDSVFVYIRIPSSSVKEDFLEPLDQNFCLIEFLDSSYRVLWKGTLREARHAVPARINSGRTLGKQIASTTPIEFTTHNRIPLDFIHEIYVDACNILDTRKSFVQILKNFQPEYGKFIRAHEENLRNKFYQPLNQRFNIQAANDNQKQKAINRFMWLLPVEFFLLPLTNDKDWYKFGGLPQATYLPSQTKKLRDNPPSELKERIKERTIASLIYSLVFEVSPLFVQMFPHKDRTIRDKLIHILTNSLSKVGRSVMDMDPLLEVLNKTSNISLGVLGVVQAITKLLDSSDWRKYGLNDDDVYGLLYNILLWIKAPTPLKSSVLHEQIFGTKGYLSGILARGGTNFLGSTNISAAIGAAALSAPGIVAATAAGVSAATVTAIPWIGYAALGGLFGAAADRTRQWWESGSNPEREAKIHAAEIAEQEIKQKAEAQKKQEQELESSRAHNKIYYAWWNVWYSKHAQLMPLHPTPDPESEFWNQLMDWPEVKSPS